MSGVGVGMIGCGGMGVVVAKLLLQQDSRIELRGLFDPQQKAIENCQSVLGLKARVYADYHDMLAAGDIDWVLIASWNCFHHEQVLAALDAGKHIFCQKPLATTPEHCAEMYHRWKRTDRMFNIGFTLRYSPHYRKIHELVSGGAIGGIVSFEFNETLDFNHGGYIMGDWRRLTKYAGTHLLEKCCHDLDLANWLTGSRARQVASFGGLNFFTPENAFHADRLGKNSKGQKAYETWTSQFNLGPAMNPFTSDKDIYDNQVAIIEYENGVRATFHTNCNSGIPERRMYILGTEGAIRADVIPGTIELKRIGFDTRIENVETGSSGGHGGGDEILAGELADSMFNGAPPATGMEDGLKSAMTAFAIDEAAETRRVVSLEKYWSLLNQPA